MSLYHFIEASVVTALVAASAWSIALRYVPATRVRLAGWCDQPWRPAWVRALGPRLFRSDNAAPSCHTDPLSGHPCGSGCDGCAAGRPSMSTPLAEQPIRIVRRHK